MPTGLGLKFAPDVSRTSFGFLVELDGSGEIEKVESWCFCVMTVQKFPTTPYNFFL